MVFPDLNGIATCGATLEKAIEMAEELLCIWIIDCKKDKTPLAEPSDINKVVLDESIGAGKRFVNIVVADLDSFKSKNNKAVKKTLTIPAWLNELAEKENVNFSKILQQGLKEYLHIDA